MYVFSPMHCGTRASHFPPTQFSVAVPLALYPLSQWMVILLPKTRLPLYLPCAIFPGHGHFRAANQLLKHSCCSSRKVSLEEALVLSQLKTSNSSLTRKMTIKNESSRVKTISLEYCTCFYKPLIAHTSFLFFL